MEKWQLENENNIQKIKNIIEFYDKNSDIIVNLTNYKLPPLFFNIKINKDKHIIFAFSDCDYYHCIDSYYFLKYNFEYILDLDQAYIVVDFLYRSGIFDLIDFISYEEKKFVRFLGKIYDNENKNFRSKEIDKNKIKSELEKYITLKQLENF